MITGIDHIVIAVHDLDKAIETYRNLGFTVVEGGKHPVGSYNALIGFQDGSYVELIAFYEESPNHPWWDLLHKRGGGLVDFCMQTNDIRADYQHFENLGVEMTDIVDLGRARPDGYYLEWINNKTTGKYQGIIPFIIEDKTPREERLPKETDHNNGVTGIDTLTVATPNLDLPRNIMATVLKSEAIAVTHDAINAVGFCVEAGTHSLEYISSDTDPLQSYFANNAPVPYAVRFKTDGSKQTFSIDQTEGVRLSLV
jgi:catechol 2,3-dioxygenase-like lactoylglutathione lyase family enzyme